MFIKPALERNVKLDYLNFIRCIMTTANLSLKSHLHFHLKSRVYKLSYEIVSMLVKRIAVSVSHVEEEVSLTTTDITFAII